MKKILAILGPTGSGKTELSIKLALLLNGEVINCDSVQLYKGFDIGTDKIPLELREKVPHHLIDLISDCRRFSAADYARLASEKVKEIASRGKLPILVGGTFLYFRALEKGLFPVGSAGEKFRNKWRKNPLELWHRTIELDPEYYLKIGASDFKRMIRLMEVFYLSGKNMIENFRETRSPLQEWRFLKLAIKRDRKELYRRIEERTEKMFKNGIIEEVRNLLALGYPESCPPFEAIGYKEVLAFIKGDLTLEETKRLVKKHTKEYARRQLMWLRREENLLWVSPEEIDKIVKMVKEDE